MKKAFFTLSLACLSHSALAIEMIEQKMEEVTKIAQHSSHTDIKFNLGSSFAGHKGWSDVFGGKAGLSIAWFSPSGLGKEIEYVWNPVAEQYGESSRYDFLFSNLIILSSFHSNHIQPHIVIGLGKEVGMYRSLAMNVKVGYEREIAEGLSWGLDYGYIRTLNSLTKFIDPGRARLGYYYGDDYRTQFMNSHISLRF